MKTERPVRRPAKNKFLYTFRDLLTGFDLSRRRLPLMMARAQEQGPLVWLTACLHGDEVGGIVVIHEVFRRLRKAPLLRGGLFAFPVANPLGYEAMSRFVTPTDEDLNRVFPGDPAGTLAERMAAQVFNEIVSTGPVLVVDIHNDWLRTIPYTLVDTPQTGEQASVRHAVDRAAAASGLLVVQDSLAEAAAGSIDRALSAALIREGIPALTLELGESHVVNERHVETGVAVIWNLLAAHGLVSADAPRYRDPGITAPYDVPLTYSSTPKAQTTGIIRFRVQPGARVAAGDTVARIYNAFGKLQETLRARSDAIVIGLDDSSVGYPGKSVVAFAHV